VRAEGEPSDVENDRAAEITLGSKPKVIAEWIKEAKKRLQAGDARMALVLGRSMHWMGGPKCLKKSGAVLEAAYKVLGRKALLGIIKAHEKSRMAPTVNTLEETGD
jgi:hypothetical protein